MNQKLLSGFLISSVVFFALSACGNPGTGNVDQEASTSSVLDHKASSEPPTSRKTQAAKKEGLESTSSKQSTEASPRPSSVGSVLTKDALQDPKQASSAEKKRLNAKEKKFIASAERPSAVDPRAVAEVGEETCQRLDFLEKADAASIPGVLTSEELPDAEAAVRHLCPEFSSQMRLAAAGFGDGEFTVGKKQAEKFVGAGTYVAGTPGAGCTWSVRNKAGTVLESGGVGTKSDFTMTVGTNADKVESSGCYAWLPAGDGGNGSPR